MSRLGSVVDDNEVNVLEPIDGGGWRYRPTASSTESSYEIAAADTEKLATGLGVDVADIPAAWQAHFGTNGRQVALTWLRGHDIVAKTRFSWVNTDWSK